MSLNEDTGNGSNPDLNAGQEKTPQKSRLKFYIPLALVVLAVIAGSVYWYIQYSKYITTDDAHVDSDGVSVSSKIMGRVIRLYADEGDTVKQGMLLAELDSTDLVAQKEQTIAVREQTVSAKTQAEAKYKYDRENIKVLEVKYRKAADDYNRGKSQYSADVITKENYEHLEKALETSKAELDAANSLLGVSRAQIGNTVASIQSADAQIQVISTQLKNTRIYAPMDGVVAKRWLLPGDIVQPGQSILTISNNRNFWVAVYLEETKMTNVRMNQKTLFTIDAYPGKIFYGKIFFIGSNTASQFSLIPPNNASGNFTKVTQRVPLKISIDGVEDENDMTIYKLMAGMSADIKIVK
ncbi:MAG: HlyD family secretion protein [Bacteroidetes bacterium]|nr:HlyD family secretion protein [Bacteroidota bacterium]